MSKLAEIVCGVMQVDPSAEAMEYRREWWTWADLGTIGDRLGAILQERGLGEGARVGGLIRNHPTMAAAMLAVVTSEPCRRSSPARGIGSAPPCSPPPGRRAAWGWS